MVKKICMKSSAIKASRFSVVRVMVAVLVISAIDIAFSRHAFAMVAPAAGSFLYSLYDYGVLQGVQGAPGFVGGVGLIVAGAVSVMKHPLLGVPALFAGVCLTQAPAIVTSMGMMI